MHLGRGEPGTIGIDHGLDHVGDETADSGGRSGRGRVRPARARTGWPMRAIFRMAMPLIWAPPAGAGQSGALARAVAGAVT